MKDTSSASITTPAHYMNIYGVPRSSLRFILLNFFNVNDEYKECLDKYFLQSISSKDFFKKMNHGLIHESGNGFIVVYHHCTPAIIRKNPDSNVLLSFRLAKPEYNLEPYVLVKPDLFAGFNPSPSFPENEFS